VKTNSKSQTNTDRAGKARKAHRPVQRDAKAVMAELLAKLSQKLEPRPAKADQVGGQAEWSEPQN
jgi:hypothetical protein